MEKKRLGVTYSPALDKAWLKIKKLIDMVEIANLSYLEKILDKPWTYHLRLKDPYDGKYGSLNLLKPEEVKVALEKSKEAILKKKPEIISVHLGPATLETGKDPIDNHIIGLSKPLSRNEVVERLLESLGCLTQFAEVIEIPLAVENLDYHSGGAYEHVCEPEFINEIFKKIKNLYLLLDVAHAEISAVELSGKRSESCLKITQEYLKRLPLQRVIEIHINSPIWKDGNPLDMHFPITNIEKRLLKDLIFLPSLQIINLECESRIEKQLKYLRKEVR